MISVISCSINPMRSANIRAHYTTLLAGHPHEIILINDAKSLCEGYNRGFAQSSGDIIIFSHDDIEILSDDFAPRLLRHLSQYDVLGVAGSSRLLGATWTSGGQPFVHGCVLHPGWGGFRFECFGAPSSRVQAIDGLFMAARRQVVEAIPFDAVTFDNFHHYDLDFSYRAYLAGFKIIVPWDILIFHASRGSYDPVWERYSERFLAKHGATLPKAGQVSQGEYVTLCSSIELVKILHAILAASHSKALEVDEAPGGGGADPLDPLWQSALLELPVAFPQTAWLGHIPFISMLVRLMRPGRYVELGVDLGTSFLTACEASRRENLGTHCLGIDTWQGPFLRVRCDGSAAFEGLSRFIAQNYTNATILRASFDEAVDQFEDGSIDLLFMTELHIHGTLKHNFETWLPKLSRRAVVLLHGTRWFGEEVGNWRFFLELRQSYWSFEFSDWHGLGMIVVGTEPDEGVRAFMEYVSRSSANAMGLRRACEAALRSMPDRFMARGTSKLWQPMPGMEKLLMHW